MGIQTIIIALLCCLAMACSSSKKSQGSGNQSPESLRSSDLKPLSSDKYEMLDDNTFQLISVSDDATYGYSDKNAIGVGASDGYKNGPLNERRFLNALRGPNGEKITYHRKSSCCSIPSKNGMMGYARLDIYVIEYEGLSQPIELYINMYDPGVPVAPKGFAFKK
jgi:hypothetical protein